VRVKAQIAMVMNLDKCLGCHTCSVTCKNVWTNRDGADYMWWNDVETKPGVGYPKQWEDQERWRGGWEVRNGDLKLKAGGKLAKLVNIFYNPDLPAIDDFYEPWTYDYDTLTKAGPSKHQPVAQPISKLTGDPLDLEWGPNWEDDLAGVKETGPRDPNIRDGLGERIKLEYENVFMMYLPRICEHCLNPSCVASCPSGAMYKREEDGIVLVDQEQCRGWRYCVSGCPYKKVYFNHNTGKAEKCTLCYPRIEAGQPTICSETCVGRLRYIGLILYDADAVEEAASAPESELLEAQRRVFLDPEDPEVREQARFDGIPEDWIESARRSPIYPLAIEWGVALPLHPEFRTLPMVWYVPPLSPVMGLVEDGEPDPDDVFPAIDEMRIPAQYLANILSAGDEEVIRNVLKRLAAMRAFKREENLSGQPDHAAAEAVGMTPQQVDDMYRLLAIAKYEDRYVIPQAHKELAAKLDEQQGTCGLEFEGGPGSCAEPSAGASLGKSVRNEEFYAMKEELERRAGGNVQAPNVQFFRKKADFEAFHLKGEPGGAGP
jgi:nitrate reductase / nitrite oxidoreductase, beta subunit